MAQVITDEQWEHFNEQGFVRIGQVATDDEFARLQQRMDDIMLGKAPLNYDQIMMQLDREPGTDRPGPQSSGHKGATLLYRKIQNLEFDPYFLEYLQNPTFEEVCAKIYGVGVPILCFRAMFMNKPAREGTCLVWHQDRWTDL
ncbi:phytanoyl-CoA dioxygenase family protein, partial [Candidatus Poribacteria bacterium]|nr:phytanoyl-CoA dioxygenase family protein [Candidatus Poribacteria bacterium]